MNHAVAGSAVDPARRQVLIASWALAYFLLAVTALHVLDWPNLPRHMSNFVFRPWSILWDSGSLALAAGLVLLGLGLPSILPASKDIRLACALLDASGVAFALLAVFISDPGPMPTTLHGWVHDLATIASMALLAAAMMVFVDGARRDTPWQPIVGTSFVWPGTAWILGFLWGFGDLTRYWPISAVLQRVVALVMVGWLIAVARRALRITPPRPVRAPAGAGSTP